MQIKHKLATVALAASILLPGGNSAMAAIPCAEVPFLPHTATAQPDWADDWQPLTLEEALQSSDPIDRTGATELPDDEGGAAISSAENLLRCLSYGQTDVFVTHATSRFRESHLGVVGDIPGGELLKNAPEGVYIELVENVYLLEDGLYLVEFRFAADNHVYTGEFVFTEVDDELYLNDSYLDSVVELTGTTHEIVITDDADPATVTASDGDVVTFVVDTEDAGTITIESEETGETVFDGTAMGSGFAGDAPRDSWLIVDVEPGTYSATLDLREAETTIEVKIVIEP